MIPATAIIHTRNSDRYLSEVIDCLRDFDEVLVCDMESSDRTLDIAARKGCSIASFPLVGFVEPARDFAMTRARHDWVFFVDSDEIVTPALARYVADFIKNPPEGAAALRVPRRNMLLGRWVKSTWPTALAAARPPQVLLASVYSFASCGGWPYHRRSLVPSG